MLYCVSVEIQFPKPLQFGARDQGFSYLGSGGGVDTQLTQPERSRIADAGNFGSWHTAYTAVTQPGHRRHGRDTVGRRDNAGTVYFGVAMNISV